MGFLRWILRALGVVGDFDTAINMLPGLVLALVGGVSAYLWDGLHWAIFIASGIFLFTTYSILLIRQSRSVNRLEHKLHVSGIGMGQAPDDEGMGIFIPQFTLQNIAGFELFFEVTKARYNYGGIEGGKDDTKSLKGVVAPTSDARLVIPGFTCKLPLPAGRMVVEVKYGREQNRLTHVYRTTIECLPGTLNNPAAPGDLPMLRNITELDYRKATLREDRR